ncbi:MAG: acetolactate decarboxylase [Bacteroidetes bacterium]|nr:acetolactate decarboxylase [Fibrella sp.]
MSKTHWLLTALAFVTPWASAQQPTGLAAPESVLSGKGRYFVSNIGAKLNADKDGDGFISELAANGDLKTIRFLPTGTDRLNAPKGMAMLGDVLYVADIDRVVGFSLSSRRQVFEQPVAGKATFLNDLTAVNQHTLLLSDTFAGRVLRLDVSTRQLTEIGSNLPGANGLAYQPATGRVFVCTMGPNLDGTGKVFSKVLGDQHPFEPVPGSPTGVLDGLAVTASGHLLVSDWQSLTATEGRVYEFDPLSRQITTLPFNGQSPADFWYDSVRQKLWIPGTLTNNVSLFPLPVNRKTGRRATAQPSRLYHIGLINGFLGGLYEGVATYQSLKQEGDFGLGAPDRLDGEVTILDGRVYQTQASGHTFEPDDVARTPYAFVHPFRADTTIMVAGPVDKHAFESLIDRHLPDPNGLYAIRVTGSFRKVQTRAFPPVTEKPYPALTTMMARQRFFDFEMVAGDLVGYRLPALLTGVNIPGYHFHFLSRDRDKGGHVLAFAGEQLTVQVQELSGYIVDVPQTADYQRFDFNQDRQAEVRQVERGRKPDK